MDTIERPPFKRKRQPLWWQRAELLNRVTRGLRINPRQLGTTTKMDYYAEQMIQRDTVATYIAGSYDRAQARAAYARARRRAQRKGRILPN